MDIYSEANPDWANDPNISVIEESQNSDHEGFFLINQTFEQEINQDIVQDVYYEIEIVQDFIQTQEITQDIVQDIIQTETRTRLAD